MKNAHYMHASTYGCDQFSHANAPRAYSYLVKMHPRRILAKCQGSNSSRRVSYWNARDSSRKNVNLWFRHLNQLANSGCIAPSCDFNRDDYNKEYLFLVKQLSELSFSAFNEIRLLPIGIGCAERIIGLAPVKSKKPISSTLPLQTTSFTGNGDFDAGMSASLRTDDNSDIMEMHVDDPPHIELKWVPGHARTPNFYKQSTFCSEPSNDFMGTVDRCCSHGGRNCDNHLPGGFQESGIQSCSYSCGVKQVTLWPKSQFEPGMGSLRFRSRPSSFPDARSYSTNLSSPRNAVEHGHARGLIDGKGLRVFADSIFIHSFRESIKKNPIKNTEPHKILAPPGSLLPADASYGTKHQSTPSISQGKFKHHEGAKAYGKEDNSKAIQGMLDENSPDFARTETTGPPHLTAYSQTRIISDQVTHSLP